MYLINTMGLYALALAFFAIAYFDEDVVAMNIGFGLAILIIAVFYTFSPGARNFIDRFNVHYKPDDDDPCV